MSFFMLFPICASYCTLSKIEFDSRTFQRQFKLCGERRRKIPTGIVNTMTCRGFSEIIVILVGGIKTFRRFLICRAQPLLPLVVSCFSTIYAGTFPFTHQVLSNSRGKIRNRRCLAPAQETHRSDTIAQTVLDPQRAPRAWTLRSYRYGWQIHAILHRYRAYPAERTAAWERLQPYKAYCTTPCDKKAEIQSTA